MIEVISNENEDSGIGRCSSTSSTSGTSTDSQKEENYDIKSINFGNKIFQVKKCDKISSKKVIVSIENKVYELLPQKKSTIKDENSTTMNKNQENENVDNKKCNKEQESNVEFKKNESEKIPDNKTYDQELKEKEYQFNMVYDYLEASQKEWDRLIQESINIRLLSIFDKETNLKIAKELKERMTDEVILLINNSTNNISLNDIIDYLPKIVSQLIEKLMYEYLQIKIKEKIHSEKKNDLLAEMEDPPKMQERNVDNNLNNLNQKSDQSQLETPVIEKYENEEKESKERINLENQMRKSDIAKMELKNMGSAPRRSFFADELFAYMRLRGTPILELPVYGVTRLDFYLLYRLVIARGGYTEVTKNNLWKNVLSSLGTPCKSMYAPDQLQQLYEQYLYPYECEKKSPSILTTLIETTVRRPNLQDIISQSYDQGANKNLESSNTRANPPVSIDHLYKTISHQYKRPLSLFFEDNEKEFKKNIKSKIELTGNQSSLELRSMKDESEFELSCGTIIPEIRSLLESKIEIGSSTDEQSSRAPSETKTESESEPVYELTSKFILKKKQENERETSNSKLIFMNPVTFTLISLILLIILQSLIVFSGITDIF